MVESLEGRRLLSVTVPDGYLKLETINVDARTGGDQGFSTLLDVGEAYFVVAGKPDESGSGFLGGNFYGNTAGIGTTSSGYKRRTDALKFDSTSEHDGFSKFTAGNAGRFTFSGVEDGDGDGSMNWGGVDQEDHVYGQMVQATGSHFGVEFRDSPLSDNSGYMTLTLYKRLPTVWVTVEKESSREDYGMSDPIVFTIHRSSAIGSLDVSYSLAGTATIGDDYTIDGSPSVQRVSFATGETEATVRLGAVPDGVAEGDETAVIRLETDSSGQFVLADSVGGSADPDKPSSASGTIMDPDNSEAGDVDLDMLKVAEDSEDFPGGYVPLNADNDNGSAYRAGGLFPVTPDRDATSIAKENDLVPIRIALPNDGNVGQVQLSWHGDEGEGRSEIKVWRSATKQNDEVENGATLTLNGKSLILYVEGVKNSDFDGAIEMVATRVTAGKAESSDALKVTVTPVLNALSATAAPNSNPAPKKSVNDWYLDTGAGLANIDATTLFASAGRKGVKGDLMLIQMVSFANNLPGGVGAQYRTAGNQYTFGPKGGTRGTVLIDSVANESPFYKLRQSRPTDDVSTQSIQAFDSPALPLGNALPLDADTSDIDVTYLFRLYAVWVFGDGKTGVVLGEADWSVHYHGAVQKPQQQGDATVVPFAPAADNKTVGSVSFDIDAEAPNLDVSLGNASEPKFRI